MKLTIILASLVVIITSGSVGIGGTIYVDADVAGADDGTSWADAYNYLQDALADANSGDEIWVAEGTYTPDSNSAYPGGTGDRTATFQLISGVALYGGFPYGADPNWNDRDPNSYETILSGDINTPGDANDNSYHVVTGGGTDATAILDGFTITAGNANYGEWPDHSYFGGGMYNDNGSPTVTNCTFNGNSAAEGGGVFNWDNSSPMVTNCTFSGNSASHGSGGGIFNIQSSPTISNCTFSGNSAYYDGGGMFNYENSNPTVTNCTFSGNSASHGGGMQNYIESNPTVTNCTFSGNSAGTYGGGMQNDRESNPTVTNCTFSGNSASWDGGGMVNLKSNPTVTNCIITGNSAGFRGGGMVNRDSDPTVTNCTFSGNSAIRLNGGGMYNRDGSNPMLTNCTFSDNSSDMQGGGIYNKQSNPTLNNCILWGNSAQAGSQIFNAFTSSTTVTYSDVQGSWPGEGNINADPLFRNASNDDLRLLPDSPCIDAGDPNYIPEPNETDLDGTTRVADGDGDGNSVVDMGAYEFTIAEPEEPLEMLAELGEMVEELGLSKGIENSLLAKVEAAIGVLEDDNEKNDGAAVNVLGAFINAVEAQTGKKIPELQAAALIAEAAVIIEALEDASEALGVDE